MKSIRFTATLLALFMSSILAGYSQESRPNILWVSVEDLSPILGAYGDPQARTPHLDRLAAEGVVYMKAYAPSPICSPTRSSLITGIYATSLGTQQLRSNMKLPGFIKTLPEHLRSAGYYTTNNVKTDYNFDPANRWDDCSATAHWRNRPNGKPFFSVFNFMTTHEGPGNELTETEKEALLKTLSGRHNPDSAQLPPYFPESAEMRRIWSHYYDLTTRVDQQVGEILAQLDEDGLSSNTIVVFFSDHGTGLPRYKRWPYQTGLRVPMIIRMPAAYRHLNPEAPGTRSERLVNLVDLAPTMLHLASVKVPAVMHGSVFLGSRPATPRTHMIAFRSRADDIFDISRTVIDDRFVYIRNYMPHQPWIPEAIIFADQKASYRELWRAKRAGELPVAGQAMFDPKPVEELYDLQADPYELDNLAGSAEHKAVLARMRSRLRTWIEETRDTDFLPESEMMARAAASTPYEMAARPANYDLKRILAQAEKTGNPRVQVQELLNDVRHKDSGVRYWATVALLARIRASADAASAEMKASLQALLNDPAPIVQVTAAEALCALNACSEQSLAVLRRHLSDEQRPWLALEAAAGIRAIGRNAAPLVEDLRAVRKTHSGDISDRGYANYLYSMFIGFAVDQALINAGSPWNYSE